LGNKRGRSPLGQYSSKKDKGYVEQLEYELAKAKVEIAKLKKMSILKGGATHQRSKAILLQEGGGDPSVLFYLLAVQAVRRLTQRLLQIASPPGNAEPLPGISSDFGRVYSYTSRSSPQLWVSVTEQPFTGINRLDC